MQETGLNVFILVGLALLPLGIALNSRNPTLSTAAILGSVILNMVGLFLKKRKEKQDDPKEDQ